MKSDFTHANTKPLVPKRTKQELGWGFQPLTLKPGEMSHYQDKQKSIEHNCPSKTLDSKTAFRTTAGFLRNFEY